MASLTSGLQWAKTAVTYAPSCRIFSIASTFIQFPIPYIAKDSLFTGQGQACSRVTWLFGLSSPCQNGPVHKNMVVDCVLVN